MASLSFDQSARFKCKEHGALSSSMFVRPGAGEGFSSFYACICCTKAVVEYAGTATPCTREQAMEIREKGSR